MTDQFRIFAGLQGLVSAAGLLALLLFFALGEQNRGSVLSSVCARM